MNINHLEFWHQITRPTPLFDSIWTRNLWPRWLFVVDQKRIQNNVYKPIGSWKAQDTKFVFNCIRCTYQRQTRAQDYPCTRHRQQTAWRQSCSSPGPRSLPDRIGIVVQWSATQSFSFQCCNDITSLLIVHATESNTAILKLPTFSFCLLIVSMNTKTDTSTL